MAPFFAFMATIASLGMVAALVIGHGLERLQLGVSLHMLLGLGSAIFTALLHCLVIGIFTGSGKDARLLVEQLKLSSEYLATVKKFRRTIFPPALKAMGALLMMAVLGGALGYGKLPGFLVLAHPVLAWVAVAYNIRIFFKEYRIIAENSVFIRRVNGEATEAFTHIPDMPEPAPEFLPDDEFATHAHALGRFLCFLGYNVWLPYIYLRYAMALLWVWWPPFLGASLLLILAGKYLQKKYTLHIVG
ncbi:MAG: hypothetical protein HYR96_10280 [Deltaproteobacteria bacterium]|nr:hypothetical protein [Deltaproteobacteria bacterium]